MTAEKSLVSNPLLEKVEAAATVEEAKRILMEALLAGEVVMTGKIDNKLAALERKTQLLLELRQSNELNDQGETIRSLQGHKIVRSEAAEKYGVTATTIIRWEQQTLTDGNPVIQVYDRGQGRGSRTIIDEGHVAAMVALDKQFRGESRRSGPIPGFAKTPPRKRRPL